MKDLQIRYSSLLRFCFSYSFMSDCPVLEFLGKELKDYAWILCKIHHFEITPQVRGRSLGLPRGGCHDRQHRHPQVRLRIQRGQVKTVRSIHPYTMTDNVIYDRWIRAKGPSMSRLSWTLNALVATFGVFLFASSTYFTVVQIVKEQGNNTSTNTTHKL